MEEETLVLIKPEGVQQNLIGEIILRFERVGLKVTGLKLLKPAEEQAEEHYKMTDEWVSSLTKKTRDSFAKKGVELKETDHEIAGRVQTWLKKHLMSGTIVAMVLVGDNAIEIVRKLVGPTEPKSAPPGTIRGDFGTDSYQNSDTEKRPILNIVHASSSPDEAKREISVWFQKIVYY